MIPYGDRTDVDGWGGREGVGCPLPEGHQTVGGEVGAGSIIKLCKNKRRSLGT